MGATTNYSLPTYEATLTVEQLSQAKVTKKGIVYFKSAS